jgi:hypothetical protein
MMRKRLKSDQGGHSCQPQNGISIKKIMTVDAWCKDPADGSARRDHQALGRVNEGSCS